MTAVAVVRRIDPVEGGTANDPVNQFDLTGTRISNAFRRIGKAIRKAVPFTFFRPGRGNSLTSRIGDAVGTVVGAGARMVNRTVVRPAIGAAKTVGRALDWTARRLPVLCIAKPVEALAGLVAGFTLSGLAIWAGLAACTTGAGCVAGAPLIVAGAAGVAATGYAAWELGRNWRQLVPHAPSRDGSHG